MDKKTRDENQFKGHFQYKRIKYNESYLYPYSHKLEARQYFKIIVEI